MLCQIGVGSFASAAIRFACHQRPPAVAIGVEPATAACGTASLAAGRPVVVETPGTSMAGLNCATPSHAAWPVLRDGLAGCVVISDDESRAAMRDLAALGIVAGDCGAASLAGLRALVRDPRAPRSRVRPASGDSRVLLVSTEGATDPASYAERMEAHETRRCLAAGREPRLAGAGAGRGHRAVHDRRAGGGADREGLRALARRLARGRARASDDLRAELLATAERDVAAFHAVLETRRDGGDEREAWAVAALVLRDAAALLDETRFLAEDVAGRCRPALRGEPLAAALLAAGAERAALALAEMDESAQTGAGSGASSRPSRPASQPAVVACTSSVVQTAIATRETAISAPATWCASRRLAIAAGTTPVSRHQARKMISLRVHAPRRSGSRQASTTSGRTTNMKNTTTTRPRTRWSRSASNGRFMPRVTNTASTAISDELRDEALEADRVAVVAAEAEQLHVADDQADHEGRQVARAAELVDGEVAERDHGQDDRSRRLAPDAGAVGRHEHGQRDAGHDAEGRADRRLCAKSPSGPPNGRARTPRSPPASVPARSPSDR